MGDKPRKENNDLDSGLVILDLNDWRRISQLVKEIGDTAEEIYLENLVYRRQKKLLKQADETEKKNRLLKAQNGRLRKEIQQLRKELGYKPIKFGVKL